MWVAEDFRILYSRNQKGKQNYLLEVIDAKGFSMKQLHTDMREKFNL